MGRNRRQETRTGTARILTQVLSTAAVGGKNQEDTELSSLSKTRKAKAYKKSLKIYCGNGILHKMIGLHQKLTRKIPVPQPFPPTRKSRCGQPKRRHCARRECGRVAACVPATHLHCCSAMAGKELLDAATVGDKTRVAAALAAGAELNHADKYGTTALMLAACYGRVAVVTLLLEAGVKMDAKSKSGRTVLDIAAQNGHAAVVTRRWLRCC